MTLLAHISSGCCCCVGMQQCKYKQRIAAAELCSTEKVLRTASITRSPAFFLRKQGNSTSVSKQRARSSTTVILLFISCLLINTFPCRTHAAEAFCSADDQNSCDKNQNLKNMAANKERTFIAIKPDATERRLIGRIIDRFEQRGYKLVGMKMLIPKEDLLKQHYEALKDKPFFPDLMKYMSSGAVVAMCWEGLDIVKQGRTMLGATNPLASNPGTIRGDFSVQTGRNIVHGSDSLESAQREIALWFKPDELCDWGNALNPWVYE